MDAVDDACRVERMHVEGAQVVGAQRSQGTPLTPCGTHLDGKGDVRLRIATRSSGEVYNLHRLVTPSCLEREGRPQWGGTTLQL